MNSGVTKYVKTECTVRTFFPVDEKGVAHIACAYCNYYRRSSNRCGLTNEIIYKPDTYTGNSCPMGPVKEEEHGQHDNL